MTAYLSQLLAQSDHNANQTLQRLLYKFILFTFITTLVSAFYSYLKHHGWTMGDWLINYQAGFVRRGLPGEISYQIHNALNISPGLVIFLMQSAAYSVFFYFSYQLLKKQKSILPYVLLIVSPFIFTFQINDLPGGFRKEIIFFALLAFSVYGQKYYSVAKFNKTFYALLLIYPLIILAHEMLAIFLPYLLIVYCKDQKITFKKIITVGLLLLPSVICFVLALKHSGTNQQVQHIYNSLIQADYTVVGGAIDWLDKTASYGITQVKERIKEQQYLVFHFHMLVLTTLAFIPIKHRLKNVFSSTLTKCLLTASILGSVALCIVAIDWGRFIYINAVAFFLLSFLYSGSSQNATQDKCITIEKLKQYCNNKLNIGLISGFLIFYTQFWHIEHSGSNLMYSQVNALLHLQPYIKLLGQLIKG